MFYGGSATARRGCLYKGALTGSCEEEEEDWVEEADGVVDDDFMDDGRDNESQQLGHCAMLLEGREEATEVQVNVVVQPIVYNDIPFAVVGTKLAGVPPICVEGPVREAGDFGPEVEPAVEEAKEAHNEE